MQVTLLGTGAAGGMPLFGCYCRACRAARDSPSLVRRPCSARIDSGNTRIVIDAGRTDLASLLENGLPQAILLTHYHVDHVQGLFELRWGQAPSLPVIGPDDREGCADLHRHSGMLDFSATAAAFASFDLGALRITPVPLIHSKPCLGYLIETGRSRLAYLSDTVGLPQPAKDYLQTHPPDLAIIDGTHPPTQRQPRNHNNLDHVRAIHAAIASDRTVITHVGHAMAEWLLDHESTIPPAITVGQDGDRYQLGGSN